VDDRQMGGQLPENRDRRGLIVDEDAAFACGSNFAADDERAVFGFIEAVVLEDLFDGVFK